MTSIDSKVVVITGSTQGIGFGLARAFLDLGCRLVVSGRTAEKVASAVSSLIEKHPEGEVVGQPCDVADFTQVQALWEAAVAHFGRVDIWINNAGVANAQMEFWKLPPDLVRTVVNTNLTGAMYGSQVALQGMLSQGYGAVYNMEGLGSDGSRKVKGLALYASTKAGLRYFNDALAAEAEGTPVLVGALRPGMVVTDMLTKQYEGQPENWEQARRIFNILADRVETVAPWLARRVLENRKNGVRISWTSGGKMMMRFLTAPFTHRQVIE